jgi:uncharacterized oligopeptide transporter (OPT) family protein
MDALALLQYAAEWGLFGIILYFVIGMIAMPDWAKRVAQASLILIGVAAILGALLGQPRPVLRSAPGTPGLGSSSK